MRFYVFYSKGLTKNNWEIELLKHPLVHVVIDYHWRQILANNTNSQNVDKFARVLYNISSAEKYEEQRSGGAEGGRPILWLESHQPLSLSEAVGLLAGGPPHVSRRLEQVPSAPTVAGRGRYSPAILVSKKTDNAIFLQQCSDHGNSKWSTTHRYPRQRQGWEFALWFSVWIARFYKKEWIALSLFL